MDYTISNIAAILEGKLVGDGETIINNIGSIEDAEEGYISFLANPKYENHVYTSKASAIIVSKDFNPKKEVTSALIHVEDPYVSFTILLEEYHKHKNFQKSGIESPSFIGEGCEVGEDIYRGAFSYIGKDSKIGNNVKIYPNTYIGDNTVVGDNTIIHAGVKIYAGSQIGSNCVIHSGCVIGSDGFGFAPQADGTYKTIPQMGNVIIEDNVDIGGNTVIDCATFKSTIVRKGVKLDNLVQVAHNADVGENTVMASQSGVSGSTKLGKNCIIGGQVGIAGHIVLGDNVRAAGKAGVSKSVKSGKTVAGAIAMDHKQFLKAYTIYRNLPQLVDRIKELEEKILHLQSENK